MKKNFFSAAFFFWLLSCGGGYSAGGSTTGGGGSSIDVSGLDACSGDALWNAAPLNSTDYTGIVPLGNLNPTGHVFPSNHIYFTIAREANATRSVPVFAPGNIRILNVSSSYYTSASAPYYDYQIYFASCRDVEGYFLHVTTISDTIAAALGSATGCTNYTTGGTSVYYCNYQTSIDVAAGTQIGTAGGVAGGSQALDMGAMDARITPLTFASSTRYAASADGFDQYHVVCPLDYFTSALRSTMRAQLGNFDGSSLRTIEPTCGTIAQDVVGSAQGIWFVSGTTTFSSEDAHLALVHDNVTPTVGTFSVGTSVAGLASGVYYFTPEASGVVNRDFDDITADGTLYCFSNFTNGAGGAALGTQFTILVQLPTSSTLKIEPQSATSCGSGPWAFTAAAATFER